MERRISVDEIIGALKRNGWKQTNSQYFGGIASCLWKRNDSIIRWVHRDGEFIPQWRRES